MIHSRLHSIWAATLPIALVLGASGCATKKYARQQVSPVNQRLSQFEKHTNEQIAAVWSKEQSDISQVNERISTTDQTVAQLQGAVSQAQGTASRAMEASDANKTSIEANSAAVSTLAAGVANSMNYQLVEKADVTFAFNQATLSPEAKAALDQIAQQVQALHRAVVELAGFTDKVGSTNYNLALSRRRAEAVQRYLVMQKVPLRSIHIVGLGKEAPPAGLEADLQAIDPNPSASAQDRLARRVHIRVFGAGDITAAR